MTYSVVMRDPETGALGVGVQSHWFNVGRIVPWVRPGVGAVATQSVAEPLYGPRGLDLMADGVPAPEAMDRLLAEDEAAPLRQLGFVDAAGRAAAYTGDGCIAHAGHVAGDGWTVQANIMRDEHVVPAMAAAAETATGGPAARILAVLEAAEQAGGDLRGSQSAALVVAGAGPVRSVDLRVEDAADPIGELRRLVDLHGAYDAMSAGDDALGAGRHDEAAARYAAAAAVAGDIPEVRFWQAVGLATMGTWDEARAAYTAAVAASPDLAGLLDRLPATGLVAEDVAAGLRE